MTNSFPVIFFFGSLFIGYSIIYLRRSYFSAGEVYVDVHGDSWPIPGESFITKFADILVEEIPRFNYDFHLLSPLFDIDSTDYLESTILYIVLFGCVGLLFFVIILLFFISRYVCGCCGGKSLPRYGYTQQSISSVRISLIIFSFLFEAILIYGYFANSDAHHSVSRLVEHFENIGKQIESDMNIIISKLEPVNDGYNAIFNQHKQAFLTDLDFSKRYSVGQSTIMKSFLDKFENLRMAMILLNLILSTIACAVGIAAGSVMKGYVMIIMVVMNTVSAVFFFFSTGVHYAGSKLIFDYCGEIEYYLTDRHWHDRIPMRLQFFIPCVNSPLFEFITDYFSQLSISAINDLKESYQSTPVYTNPETKLMYSPPMWFNVSDQYYLNLFQSIPNQNQRNDVLSKYNIAVNRSNELSIVDRHSLCSYSKERLREESFLMCEYTKDNLDCITVTQLCGCLLVIIITCIGIPAIKKFEWAGNANLGGLNQKRNFAGSKKKPRAKRVVGGGAPK